MTQSNGRKGFQPWSWSGAIVMVMALALSLGWVVAVVVVMIRGEPVSGPVGSALSGIGGALVAMVSGYLGRRWRVRQGGDDEGA